MPLYVRLSTFFSTSLRRQRRRPDGQVEVTLGVQNRPQWHSRPVKSNEAGSKRRTADVKLFFKAGTADAALSSLPAFFSCRDLADLPV
jgi:hypothetical protein